jgi:hypothetical protein
VSVAEQFSRSTLESIHRVIRHLGQMQGQRVLVLVSSGFFTNGNTHRPQEGIVETALRSRVVISSLDAKGLVADMLGGEPSDGPPITLPRRPDLQSYADKLASDQRTVLDDPLALLSQGTGGRFFHNSNDLDRGMLELASVPEVSYLLAFSPQGIKPDGRFHNLKVKLRAEGKFQIQARRGYHAPTKDVPPEVAFQRKFDANVFDTKDNIDFPIRVTTRSESSGTGSLVLRGVIHIDVSQLPFRRQGDRNIEKMRSLAAFFDPDGNFLGATEVLVELALREPTLKRLSTDGLNASFSLQAPANSYKLRVVVQELLQGRLTALTQTVELR